MIAALTLFWQRLLCRHRYNYDGLDNGASQLIVRVKCSECGKVQRSGQPVNKLPHH